LGYSFDAKPTTTKLDCKSNCLQAYGFRKAAHAWRACAAELREEVMDLRRVLAQTRQHFNQEVTKGSGKVR
jgi:erythromycin esterase-like protein